MASKPLTKEDYTTAYQTALDIVLVPQVTRGFGPFLSRMSVGFGTRALNYLKSNFSLSDSTMVRMLKNEKFILGKTVVSFDKDLLNIHFEIEEAMATIDEGPCLREDGESEMMLEAVCHVVEQYISNGFIPFLNECLRCNYPSIVRLFACKCGDRSADPKRFGMPIMTKVCVKKSGSKSRVVKVHIRDFSKKMNEEEKEEEEEEKVEGEVFFERETTV